MGWSIIAGGLTLALMILPTIIRTTEEAIRTVPRSYRDVSYSLGATRWKMVTTAVRIAAAALVNGLLTAGAVLIITVLLINVAASALITRLVRQQVRR